MRNLRSLVRSFLQSRWRYDPLVYWNERRNPNSATPEMTRDHIEYVRRQVSDCKHILDLGPGIGRIFPAYGGLERVEGYDISSAYRDRALGAAAGYSFDFTLRVEDGIGRLPYEDDRFDAAVSVSVLLHQTPDRVVDLMEELARVARKVVIVSLFDAGSAYDPVAERHPRTAQYCFNYDYFAICETNGWTILDSRVDPSVRQIFFVYATGDTDGGPVQARGNRKAGDADHLGVRPVGDGPSPAANGAMASSASTTTPA